MAPSPSLRQRALEQSLQIETKDTHHITGPFRPQTPLDAQFPESPTMAQKGANGHIPAAFDRWSTASRGFGADIMSMRWIVVPSSSLKMIITSVVLWANWEILAPYVGDLPNPFAPLLFISYRILDSSPDDPRYSKGILDFVFVSYYIVVFSFVRQFITLQVSRPVGQWFGIKRESKLARFGEQGYALVYFAVMGAWGARIMSQSPIWWYDTKNFWLGYPHWDMKPELKRYYLMEAAYWCHQLIVLLLNLEKPRKDYAELVAHHLVTLWLVGASYVCNMTQIGNAVYLSMDVPDAFFAFSKLLNYIQWEYTKVVSFVIFVGVWSYFRIFLNMVMLWSVWTEYDLIPLASQRFWPPDGVWMVWWMKYQVFIPIFLLLCLNLFWYFLILRIMYRVVGPTQGITDVRSDDEDDGGDDGGGDGKDDGEDDDKDDVGDDDKDE
ncbi:Sphingosine N-acyltransferase lac1 [Sparassis crispa]|uniref:Sphingosine N-acyltransferase lac1 n=1 Tax=Sparassis crispa TaxID=139825 RepID=A0A401GC42_9APHY|nr:Sphingosine N-acyltransferase lac1 [Sparassis crispa]GBE79715.1 Sphingosine N-acyltransferase lac1 [Sparassis crispa]